MVTKLFDSITFNDASQRQITPEGYLIAPARLGRTGIQYYKGKDLGKQEGVHIDPNKVYSIYRPADEVFNPDHISSIKSVPIINHEHKGGKNATWVTSDNWKQLSVGEVISAQGDGAKFIDGNIIVKDKKAVSDVERGKKQLSLGYSSELKWGDGETQDGIPYHAIQTNMRANHLAIVHHARAGHSVSIADAGDEHEDENFINKGKTMNTRTVLVDGLQVEVTDQGAVALEKVLKERDAAVILADKKTEEAIEATKVADASSARVKELEAQLSKHNEEGEKLKKELEDAKKNTVSADEMDAKVEERADTKAKGKKLAPDVDDKGKTNDSYRKEVVKKVADKDKEMKKVADSICDGKDIDELSPEMTTATFNAIFTASELVRSQSGTRTALGDSLGATFTQATNDVGGEPSTEPSGREKYMNRLQTGFKEQGAK